MSLAVSGAAWAQTTRYVDVAVCADPGPHSGTEADPFCTIQAGIDAAADQDTILVAPGTYHEAIHLLAKGITLRSSGGSAVTSIDATGLHSSVVSVDSGSDDHSRTEGFTITGGSGSTCEDAPALRCGGGVYVYDRANAVSFSDCVIVGNSADLGGGMFVYGSTGVDRCILSDNHSRHDGGAVYAQMGLLEISNTLIRGNTAAGDGGALFCLSWDGLEVKIVNATVVGNTANRGGAIFEIRVEFPTTVDTGPVITNSIVWGNDAVTSGDQIYNESGAPPFISYSDIEGSGGWLEWDFDLGEYGGRNVDIDPEFVDPNANDFHLSGDSPCVDAGNTSASNVWSKDLDGDVRFRQAGLGGTPVGGWPKVDLGAYEFLRPDYCGNALCESNESTANCVYDCGAADGVLHVPSEVRSIQGAVWAAGPGDEIVVAPGIYQESVQLQGRPIHLRSMAGPESTVIDAESVQTRGVTIDRGDGADTVFEGFTILGGVAAEGGGMYIARSSPTIRDCRFIANDAVRRGGGLYIEEARPTIDACTFLLNESGGNGGGVYASGVTVAIQNSSFLANSALNGGGGGLMSTSDSEVSVVGSTFSGNQAFEGSGLYVDHGTCTVTDSTFRTNGVQKTHLGGGIYASGVNLTVRNSSFFDNHSSGSGGAIFLYDGPLTVSSSHFEGNTVGDAGCTWYSGGAIYTESLAVTITGCSFLGNAACQGGAIGHFGARLVLANSILVGNRAGPGDYWPGSAVMVTGEKSSFDIANCTIVDNVGVAGAAIVWDSSPCDPAITSNIDNSIIWSKPTEPVYAGRSCSIKVSHSNLGGGLGDILQDGGGNIDAEPLFLRLPERDGSGVVVDYGDLRLRSGSPGIDAGDNAAVSDEHATDAQGLPRFADDPCTVDTGSGEAPIVDMGAYELHPESTCGDGVCTGEETCWNCGCDCGLCCGDGVCDAFESCLNCPDDCACRALHVPEEYETIQEAIDASHDGDKVVVAAGVYHETFDFSGKAITVRGEAGAADTIIDGENRLGPLVSCISGEGSDTVLKGFTLRRGRADQGGAMLNRLSSPTIEACVFDANHATSDATYYGGGAIYNQSAHPTIRACLFTRNRTSRRGGAILNWDASSPTVINSAFVGNEADYGGACYLLEGTPKFIHCSFSGNRAYSYGGGIRNFSADATITGCVVWGNYAPNDPGIGSYEDPNVPVYPVITFSDVHNSGGSANWDTSIGVDGGGNIDADPLFVRLPSEGADGWGDNPDTPDVNEGANDDFGDLRLQAASPAINAGDPSVMFTPGAGDLAGHTRVLCGRVDMGCYEFGIGDYNCDGVVDLSDFLIWPQCETGPGGSNLDAPCGAFDFNADGAIGLDDFAAWSNVGTESP